MPRHRTSTAIAPITFSRAPVRAPLARRGSARLAALKTKASAAMKRAGARSRAVAFEQRHKIVSIGVGVGLGLLRRFAPDTMDKLSFGPATPEMVVGLGALILSYFVKNPYLDHIATGALTVGGFQLASGAGAVSGVGEY